MATTSTTSAGRLRVNLALSPATYAYLREHSQGERGLSEVVDRLVQEKRVFAPLEERVKRLEAVQKGECVGG